MTLKKIILLLAILLLAALTAAGPVYAQCGAWGHHGSYQHHVRGQQAPGPLGPRLYNPATVMTISGSITAVDVTRARPGGFAGMHVTLDVDGKATRVHLGPLWFVQAEGLILTKGDKLEVSGSMVTRGEQAFLIARDVKKNDKVVKLRNAEGRPLWAPRRHF